jgi:hypothetical protein
MYASDWERLGLGPTRDIPTIKRAYALQLRTTRPDDDAQAYQALREAYERAQYWARYVPDDEELEEDTAEADNADDTGGMPDENAADESAAGETLAAQTSAQPAVDGSSGGEAQAGSPHAEPLAAATTSVTATDDDDGPSWQQEAELPIDETPEALVDRSYHLWRGEGTEALLQAWPKLEAALDRLPLVRRPEASARFADLVISCPELPPEFMQQLQLHFGWLGDFRIDRMIGTARAEALRQALAEVVVMPVQDPQVLQQFADLRGLHRLLQRRWPVHAWLYTALLGWPLWRQMAEAGPRLLRGLGIEADDQKKLGHAFDVGLWARLALMAGLLLGACALITSGNWVEAIAATATTAAGGVAVLGAALIAGTKVSEFLQARASQSDVIGRWLQRGRGPWLGLAAGAASIGFYAWARVLDSPFGPWAAGVLLTCLSIVFFWPLRPDLGVVTAATWGFLVACLMRVAPAGNYFFVMVGAAGLATLIAVQHAEGRWAFPFRRWAWVIAIVIVQVVRHAQQGALAFWITASMCSIAAALLTLSRAPIDGYRSAMLPMALAAGVTFALDESRHSPLMLYVWCIAGVLVMGLQFGARWLGLRWYRRAADSA